MDQGEARPLRRQEGDPRRCDLADAYQRASECKVIQKAIEEKLAEIRKTMTAATVPGDLRARSRRD